MLLTDAYGNRGVTSMLCGSHGTGMDDSKQGELEVEEEE